ncbi:Tim44 domain-containing protein [Sphaerotilus microaerophilus]|nr:TIM44-like domain-containing protein [Sphaerotilus sp. FB-5]
MNALTSKEFRMKNWWLGALALVVAVGLTPPEAQAKRLGSGGMQRSMPSRSAADAPPPRQAPNQAAPAQQATPAQQAAPATAGAAAAQAGKRSWLGPIAGLAAGIGLAALLSHFGMGEAVANFLMMALLALAAVFVIGWLMRRFSAGKANAGASRSNPFEPAYAGAGAGSAGTAQPVNPTAAPMARQADFPAAAPGSAAASFAPGAASTAVATAPAVALPADFDRAAFERIAKLIFIRMQAANDRCDLNDLRQFTTPEMFASIRLDLQNRGDSTQQTDVVHVDAEVLDLAREDGREVVSVRYHGQVREEPSHPATPFDEVWHLVRPADGSRDWAIAGIQPLQ